MAKLILTPEEKAAARFADWDDATIGKLVKKVALSFINETEQFSVVASYLLITDSMIEANADKATYTMEGVTHRGKPVGDFVITVERV